MKYFTVYFNIFNQLNSNQIFGGIFEAYLFKNIDLNAGVQIHSCKPSDQKNKFEVKMMKISTYSIHDFSLY